MNDDDDIRAAVHRAALGIKVEDRFAAITGGNPPARPTRVRLVPLLLAAAIGAILLTVAVVRATGSGPASSPAMGGPNATTQQSWQTGEEVISAVRDGRPSRDLRAIALRTAGLLRSADQQGLLDAQRPDLPNQVATTNLVKNFGNRPVQPTIYYDPVAGDDSIAVSFSVECGTSGTRASVTLHFSHYQQAWYLNLDKGVGGLLIQNSDSPPPPNAMLTCIGQ